MAAVGVPDDRWGERPVLVAVAEGEVEPAIRARLQTAVAAGDLPKWAVPDRICRVAVIPKTSVGKLDKKRIRAMLASGEMG